MGPIWYKQEQSSRNRDEDERKVGGENCVGSGYVLRVWKEQLAALTPRAVS